MLNVFFMLLALLGTAAPAAAAEAGSEGSVLSVYGTACEPIRGTEARSSVRMRAADKACFAALENLNTLSEYRNSYATPDYNVLVYALIDNYLEDLTVRTTEHSQEKICVEITGFLDPDNISAAVKELDDKHRQQYPDKLEIEPEALDLPAVTDLPPKPDIKISKEIAVEEVLPPEEPVAAMPQKHEIRVFIERTKFYDDTSTNAFYKTMAKSMEENASVALTNSLSDADYILRTKVLRAKVDPINRQTNRLQLVVALELINTQDGSVQTEHQNRFILFETSDDEQKVASSLLSKLLSVGSKQLAPRVKPMSKTSVSVITPPPSPARSANR